MYYLGQVAVNSRLDTPFNWDCTEHESMCFVYNNRGYLHVHTCTCMYIHVCVHITHS